MSIPARYVSPDGLITFDIIQDKSDIILGFVGFPWHTHGDLLAAEGFGDSEQTAVEEFVAQLLQNKLIIAVFRRGDEICAIQIDDDPEGTKRYMPEDETVEFRYWDGSAAVP